MGDAPNPWGIFPKTKGISKGSRFAYRPSRSCPTGFYQNLHTLRGSILIKNLDCRRSTDC